MHCTSLRSGCVVPIISLRSSDLSKNLAGREVENARVAFESAVRWGRSGHSLVNLGVFEMRQRRFDEALAAMWEAKTGHSTADAAEHIDENWRGLMQTMSALGVDVPAKYQGDAPARVGGREGPSILTRKAGARVDSSI